MEKNKKNIIIKRSLRIFLILLILVSIIPIPINRTYDAVEIKLDDPNYIVQCQIKIQGRYHLNFLTDDMFAGKIIVSDYRSTNEIMSKVYISKDGWPLEYTYYLGKDEDGRPITNTFFLGHIDSKNWFKEMAILVFSENPLYKDEGGKALSSTGTWGRWTASEGYCIVPLATNREEAIDKLLKMGIIGDSK